MFLFRNLKKKKFGKLNIKNIIYFLNNKVKKLIIKNLLILYFFLFGNLKKKKFSLILKKTNKKFIKFNFIKLKKFLFLFIFDK
jgi:hypothetical protein